MSPHRYADALTPDSTRRYHGHTPDEAAREGRERASAAICFIVVLLVLCAFAAPFLRG